MNYELLNYLKSSIDQEWLWCWNHNNNHELNELNQAKSSYQVSQLLNALIDVRVAQISSLAKKCPEKPAILIVETQPLNFIVAFLAGVITQVNIFLGDPAWQKQEWRQVLGLVQPDLILGDDAVQSKIKSLIPQLKSRLQNTPDLITEEQLQHQSLIMIPTGGTSGKIKFAMHSWEALSSSVKGFQEFFNCSKINSVCTLPLFHVSGLMQLMRSLLTQGNLVICPYKSIVPRLSHLNKSAYFISLVPTQLQFFLESTPNWLAEFQTVLVGGAPSRRSLLNTARKYQIPLALIYGMTETASGVVVLKPQDFLQGNNSSGQVLPHAQVKISNTQNTQLGCTKAIALQSVQTGLIQLKSTSLCLGYYPQLFPNSQSFMTDDLGYFDDHGYLHLLGRNSHKIITGGENVFPAEVEAVIYATKLVQDVCVVGLSDRQWGEVVAAVYVLSANNLNTSDNSEKSNHLDLIKEQIRSQLAKYKQPKHWLEVSSIPRNNRGKVNYQQLKAIAIQAINTDKPH